MSNDLVPVKGTTIVSLLLDETGSMESIRDDTIGGFNAYVDSLRDEKDGPVEFTFVKFDSNRIEKVCVGSPIKDVARLTRDTYRPGAMTPLIDACVKTIKATEQVVEQRADKPKVIVVFQTDGDENASREYKLSDLQDLIKAKTAEGWLFVYLGAGIDAYQSGANFGISAANTMSYASTNSAQAFAAMGASTARYRATGSLRAAAFTADEKLRAGDAFDPANVWTSVKPQPGPVPPVAGTAARTATTTKKPIVDDLSFVA